MSFGLLSMAPSRERWGGRGGLFVFGSCCCFFNFFKTKLFNSATQRTVFTKHVLLKSLPCKKKIYENYKIKREICVIVSGRARRKREADDRGTNAFVSGTASKSEVDLLNGGFEAYYVEKLDRKLDLGNIYPKFPYKAQSPAFHRVVDFHQVHLPPNRSSRKEAV